ncbi:MAG: GntR family transcriptional regulator [Victivallaceae bacterium]|nr:GntR family transcriptional regulator [Victivallaceae bacterium]
MTVLEKFKIDYGSGVPVYRQLIDLVCHLAGSGELAAGAQLPTIRELTAHLEINPNTVAKAYRELELMKVIESCRGRGSFIAQGAVPKLTAKDKAALLDRLFERFGLAAGGAGISTEELADYLTRRLGDALRN